MVVRKFTIKSEVFQYSDRTEITLCDFLYLQPEADGKCGIDLVHGTQVKLAHFVFEPPFVDGAYLLQQHDAVTGKTAFIRLHLDMGRQMGLVFLACDGGGYDRGAVAVA